MAATFGENIRKDFLLDPNHIYLNHGFGKVPRTVFDARLRMLTEIHVYPETWLRFTREKYWSENIEASARFLHADPNNLVFVQNTTTGLNCVLKSLHLGPGDAILMYSWQYPSVDSTIRMTAKLTGCEVVVAEVTLPIKDKQDILDLYQETLDRHPNIKVAVIELICSITAVLIPIKELTAMCKKRGVTVVIDGAHGPGQVPLNLEELGSIGIDCFVGSFHKWLLTPMGCAVLWIHPRLHATIRPVVTSRVLDSETPGLCFSFQGMRDDTPFYTAKVAIDYFEKLGGLEPIVQYSRDLLDKAVALLLKEWGSRKFPIPTDMEAPCMRLVTLPHVSSLDVKSGKEVVKFASAWIVVLKERFNITSVIFAMDDVTYIRLACTVYNTLEDFQKLAEAVKILVQEDDGSKNKPQTQTG